MEKFNDLLQLMNEYVNKGASTRKLIDAIAKNPNYSQSKIASDINNVKTSYAAFGSKCNDKANAIIDEIATWAEGLSSNLDLPSLSATLTYISAAGSNADGNVIGQAIKRFRGNLLAIKAIYTAAENCKVPSRVLKEISSYFYDLNGLISLLKKDCQIVFSGNSSASESSIDICRKAALLGVNIKSTVKDEWFDNMEMRKAAGLI